MRIAKLVGFVFLSGSLASVAQVAPFSVEEGQVVRSYTPACPLDMHVRQRGAGQMVATDQNGARVEMFAARLKLLLSDTRTDRTSQRMVKATVTVRGWNGKAKVLPIGSTLDRNGNLVSTMTVSLTGGGLPDASADLLLPGFTAARTVELESITFDDGQVWSFTGPAVCRVAPDLLMPVRRPN